MYATAADRRANGMESDPEVPCADGFALTDDGRILLQLPAFNEFGFVLADEEQAWDGGHGSAAMGWEMLDDDDPRISDDDRDRLIWVRREWMTDFNARYLEW